MSSVKAESEQIIERSDAPTVDSRKSTELQETKESIVNSTDKLRQQGKQAVQQGWDSAKRARRDVDEKYLQPTRRIAADAFSKHPLAVTVSTHAALHRV